MGYSSFLLVGRKKSKSNFVREIRGYNRLPFVNIFINKLLLRDLLLIKKTDLFETEEYAQADVIVLHNLHGGYFNLGNLVRIAKEKPILWVFHDQWPILGNSAHALENLKQGCFLWKLYQRFLNRVFQLKKKQVYIKSTFHIVTPSQWLKKKVQNSLLNNRSISVINNGIDTRVFRELSNRRKVRTKYGIPEDAIVLLFVASGGSGNSWKGGEYLKQVISILKDTPNILFIEVGCKIDSIDKMDNHWRFPFITSKIEMNEILNCGNVFLFTSIAENFPLVLIEAQLVGLPVVTFDVGGAKEIVVHMETGYVSRYRDIEDFVKGLKEIISNPKLSESMSMKARKRAASMFSLESQVSKYLNLYRRIINEK